MSTDTIVALIRNGLCCIKDLGLFSSSILYQPSYVALFYTLPAPLNECTPLQVLIGLTQLYAVLSMSTSGFCNVYKGFKSIRRAMRLRNLHDRVIDDNSRDGAVKTEEENFREEAAKAAEAAEAAEHMQSLSPSDRVIRHSLDVGYYHGVRNIFIGFNVMVIGFCFIWLCANSFNITKTGWLGGVQGLIHSLTAAEIGLLALLYCMASDGSTKFRDSDRVQLLKRTLIDSHGRLANVTTKDFVADSHMYGWVQHGGWTPFWNSTSSAFDAVYDEEIEGKLLREEAHIVERTIEALFAEEKNSPKKASGAHGHTSDKNGHDQEEKNRTLSFAVQVASARLEKEASMMRMQGYLEYVYFALNLTAFYGYMICVLSYYLPDGESDVDARILSIWNRMKLGMKNKDADWSGNFAGKK